MLQPQLALGQNNKPTPFTLLCAVYNARLALTVQGFSNLQIEKQCEYLQTNNIQTKSSRKTLIRDLVEKEKDFAQLSSAAYIRIHIKYILSLFYKETQELKTDCNISSWSKHEMLLSFIGHLISESAHDESQNKKNTAHEKIWEFVEYLRRYFYDTNYDGQQFLNAFNPNKSNAPNDKPTKGFGLQMMKTVCTKYTLKSGPFSKVKKQCNIWATKIHHQSNGHIEPPKKPVPVPSNNAVGKYAPSNVSKPHNYSKFVTDVSMYVNQQQPASLTDNLSGKKWYWFSDSGGFKWVPYREVDMQKLNTAWRNNQKSALIINGQYRVEFDRKNPSVPAGNQYNNNIQNAGGRTVICSEPKSDIHGITVGKQPM